MQIEIRRDGKLWAMFGLSKPYSTTSFKKLMAHIGNEIGVNKNNINFITIKVEAR